MPRSSDLRDHPIRRALARLARDGLRQGFLPQGTEALLDLARVRVAMRDPRDPFNQTAAVATMLTEASAGLSQQHRSLLEIVLALDPQYEGLTAVERRTLAGEAFRGGSSPVAWGTIRQYHEPQALDGLAAVLIGNRPAPALETSEPTPPPTAIVCWAHGDAAWQRTVSDFVFKLRDPGGVDAVIDLFHNTDPTVDWSYFGPAAISKADFVLLAVDETFRRGWERRHDSQASPAGAVRDAQVVRGLLAEEPGFDRRLQVVTLPGATNDDIPLELRGRIRHYEIPRELEILLRAIRGHTAPPARTLPVVPMTHARAFTESALTAADAPTAAGGSVRAQTKHDFRRAARDALAIQISPATEYLYAELDHSVGAYAAASKRLTLIADHVHGSANPLEQSLATLAQAATALNQSLRYERHRWPLPKGEHHRHPLPPGPVLDIEHERRVGDFYAVACKALSDTRPSESLQSIRRAILACHPDTDAELLRRRYMHQAALARCETSPEVFVGSAVPDRVVESFARASPTSYDRGDVAADVLRCLTQANLDLHHIEHDRSLPVGELLARTAEEKRKERELARRSIMLTTFTFAISGAMPWIFGSSEEGGEIRARPSEARRDIKPRVPMWLARQAALLSLYRRADGYRLLGEHRHAHNDLRELQRIGRLARAALKGQPEDHHTLRMTSFVATIDLLAEYRIGGLYQADNDYTQALVHLFRSHEQIQAPSVLAPGEDDRGLFEIGLQIGKGRAFFESGALKRSLKWFAGAWLSLLDLIRRDISDDAGGSAHRHPGTDAEPRERILALRTHLERIKHEPEFEKGALERYVVEAVKDIRDNEVPPYYRALAAEILQGMSQVVMVMRLDDMLAETLLLRAADLDDGNLLVKTGLLRCEVRGRRETSDFAPMASWGSDPSDVDQAIRVAEHIMLERLARDRADGPSTDPDINMARRLLEQSMTHTDSLSHRLVTLDRYLKRGRAEEQDPGLAEPPRGDPYLELLCLRRFGSFEPLLARPAALSSIAGGYLVRACWPADSDPEEGGGEPRPPIVFNILVDAGEGVVNNLYSVGLAVADIDMVIATQDHPDHIAALDAVLSLRGERPRMGGERATDAPPMLILGNGAIVRRYAFLERAGDYVVRHIAGGSAVLDECSSRHFALKSGDEWCLPKRRLDIRALPPGLPDHAGEAAASGFVLEFGPGEHGDIDASVHEIAFLSNSSVSALVGLGLDATVRRDESDVLEPWQQALTSDIVVAHIGDVPNAAIGRLAHLTLPPETEPPTALDDSLAAPATEPLGESEQLMHALSMLARDHGDLPDNARLLDAWTLGDPVPPDQDLPRRGLLAIAKLMDAGKSRVDDRSPQLLVIGEVREQLGAFRGTLAREINTNVRRSCEPNAVPGCVAVTADVGLRIRVGNEGRRNLMLCSTCSVDNDRLDAERFHDPQAIREVCVKGDREAMYWNCSAHVPGDRNTGSVFVEEMGGYDPFSAGGRYHG